MAVIYKTKTDVVEEIWYESSNIHYTKVDISKLRHKILKLAEGIVPTPTTEEKTVIDFTVPILDVTVVFNRGAQYIYKDVEIHDYQSFVEILNREAPDSHGKAFNRFIKTYPFEKLDDVDIDELKIKRLKYEDAERISKMEYEEKVGECLNNMINGNVTNEYLIEKFGVEVVTEACDKEARYLEKLC